MLKSTDKKNVFLTGGLFRERMDVNRDYLMELNTNALLQSFYLEAGIVIPGLQVMPEPDNSCLHWGWEAPTCQLRGHFLGHWLSAAASLYATENDYELKAKLDKIIDELAKCQQLNGGKWLGSIPEKFMHKLENKQYVWSPQYVMHKTLMGLMHAYTNAGNTKALELISNLSDWYTAWIDKVLQGENPWAVYSGESGGMLEIWIALYDITGDEKYMRLTEKYFDPQLFRDLEDGKDALTNCHANASIPLSHGAAKLYEVTGDEKWRRITELFWKNAITDRGTFCTGGQGAGEFWTPPNLEAIYLTDSNQEFCTVYNLVRTAQYLYKWTGNTQYADFIELSLYNGFLAQQNPYTGMPTYFLPLKDGSKKKWGSKTRDFWCCHGTMVQAQTLYPDLIYLENKDEKSLVISQYIPSRISCKFGETHVTVEQNVNMKYYNEQAFFDEHDEGQTSRWSLKFTVTAEENVHFTLSFRVPSWVKNTPSVMINGKAVSEIDLAITDGYLNISKNWKNDTVEIYFPAGLRFVSLPDAPQLTAVMEGPIVLAGICDSDKGLHGNFAAPETFLRKQIEHTYSVFPWKQSTYQTINQAENFTFRPLYELVDETYTVYFTKK